MSTPQDSPVDKTIRDKIMDIITDEDKDPQMVTGWSLDYEKAVDRIETLLLEARIDELEKIWQSQGKYIIRRKDKNDIGSAIKDRLNELKGSKS